MLLYELTIIDWLLIKTKLFEWFNSILINGMVVPELIDLIFQSKYRI